MYELNTTKPVYMYESCILRNSYTLKRVVYYETGIYVKELYTTKLVYNSMISIYNEHRCTNTSSV